MQKGPHLTAVTQIANRKLGIIYMEDTKILIISYPTFTLQYYTHFTVFPDGTKYNLNTIFLGTTETLVSKGSDLPGELGEPTGG